MERSRTASGQLAALSDRQREVLALVCDGLPNKVIANALGLSEGTIKSHLHTIYETVGVGSRTELIILSNRVELQSANY
jgi:two-component system, NarL family, nitrate/nitrite response regulator NarL